MARIAAEARDGIIGCGQLIFLDTQGTSDPEWTGLGSRYRLSYQQSEEQS
jgi:hypothetical protein